MVHYIYRLMNRGDTLGYLFQVLPITITVTLIYIICRCSLASKRGTNKKTEAVRAVFVCYLTGLVNLVLVPRNFWLHCYSALFFGHRFEGFELGTAGINLVPLLYRAATGEYVIGVWTLEMLILNAAMFIPLGFLITLVTKKINRRNILLFAIAVPIATEILQPLLGRDLDIDDMIMNFVGILVGYALSVMAGKSSKKLRGIRGRIQKM